MKTHRILWTLSVVLSLTLIVTGCAATGRLFTPGDDGTPGAGTQAASAVADATGNPLIIAGVGLLNLLITALLTSSAKKHATTVANGPLTDAQVKQAKGA